MAYRSEPADDSLEMTGPDRAVPPSDPTPAVGPTRARFPTPALPPVRRAPTAARATPAPARPATASPPAYPPPAPVAATAPVRPLAEFATINPEVPMTVDVSRRSGHRDRGRRWQIVIGGAAALVLLTMCGVITAALVTGGNPAPEQTPTAAAPGPDGGQPANLRSRDIDPAPLTAKEVFPARDLIVADGAPAYQVLKTHSSASCEVAATGQVGDLLTRLGCNQVVRATLRSGDKNYLVTAGLFNLTDQAGAERARDRVKPMLDARKGRFSGMTAGKGTDAVARSSARVGWQAQGHYLAYCVVARADGKAIPTGDRAARDILTDLLEGHLRNGVLGRRSTAVTAPPAATAPPGR